MSAREEELEGELEDAREQITELEGEVQSLYKVADDLREERDEAQEALQAIYRLAYDYS